MTPSQPEYRTIPLTQGQVAIVDAQDYDNLAQFQWQASWAPGMQSFYATRSSSREGGKRYAIKMHREILGLKHGDPRNGDHGLGKTLDNRRIVDGKPNLRIANHAQNTHNSKTRKSSRTGFKGVTRHPNRRGAQFQARITHQGRRISLGYRKTAELAWRELFVPAAILYHKEFARIA